MLFLQDVCGVLWKNKHGGNTRTFIMLNWWLFLFPYKYVAVKSGTKKKNLSSFHWRAWIYECDMQF